MTGRPTTALNPMFGYCLPFEAPVLTAVGVLDDARRPVLQRAGEPALEDVRRLDDVVVDGDERVLARLTLRFGQKRHGAGTPAADGEAAVGQVIRADAHPSVPAIT